MGSKTPVSILQEMMSRLGAPPKYDLIYDGSGTHTAIFKYMVYANNVTAIGSGRSKKEAKHEAARLALEKLALHQIADAHPPGAPEPAVEVMTPYKDKIQENAVGALQVMCCTHDIPQPEYDLIEEKGAPHDKIFTYVCSVSKQREVGIGRTKKQAKQLAAFNMMNRLKESLGEVLKDVEDEPDSQNNIERAGAKYVAAVGTPRRKIKLNRSLATYHNFFHDSNEELIQKGREVLMSVKWSLSIRDAESLKDVVEDWMEILKETCEALELTLRIVPSKPGKKGECAFIQIAHTSDAVFYGMACDFESAVQEAALCGLRFLYVQLCGDGS